LAVGQFVEEGEERRHAAEPAAIRRLRESHS
jgi:hypothetical protein